MEKEALKRIFEFLKEKEGKSSIKWKIIHNEPFKEEEFTEEELIFDEYLDLSGINITSLPKGLQVWGDFYLRNCKSLTSLPEGLKVSGKLQLKKTPLAELSDESLKDMIGLNGYIEGKNKRRRTFR